jgi:outer membrane protein assembly factor BamD (BamD/ComL family)
MNKLFLLILSVLFIFSSFSKIDKKNSNSATNNAEELYTQINFENINRLNQEVFYKAFLGFENLKKAGKLDENSHLLTVCDFSLSANQKRLWVIDLT